MAIHNPLSHADSVLKQHNQKWTVPRRLIFDALVVQTKPQSAYQLIDHIVSTTGHTLKPPSAYRALQFFQEVGLAVKVEGLNAFMLCRGHDHGTQHVFFVCDACGDTNEHCNSQISESLLHSAQHVGFKPTKQIIELHGECRNCQK